MKKILLSLLILVMLLGIGYIVYRQLENREEPQPTQATTQAATQPTQATTQAAAQPTQATAQPTTEATEQTLPPAPDFTVYDLEGNPVTLSSFLGKPVVLNFWASWCGPCKMEMPEFEQMYLELGSDVVFLMLNVTTSENSREDAVQLMEQLGYTFPVYYDLSGEASGRYGISAFPTTFFISAQGEAVARAVGAIDAATLRKGIDMIR